MRILIFYIILQLTYVSAISGNKGACQSGDYTDFNLDTNKYLGKWFSLYVSQSFEHIKRTDKCAFANFLLNYDGTLNVHNESIDQNNNHITVEAKGFIISPGEFNDYDIAAVVGCNGFYKFGSSDVQILARDYNPDDKKKTEIQQVIDKVKQLGFDISDLVQVDVSGCSFDGSI